MDKPQSVWAFDVEITELHNLDNRFVEKEQSMKVAADLVRKATGALVCTSPAVVSMEGLIHKGLVEPLQSLGFNAPELTQVLGDVTKAAVQGAINIRRLYMSGFYPRPQQPGGAPL